MAILVINAGSSSLKVAVIDPATGVRRLSALAERLGGDGATLTVGKTAAKPLNDGSAVGALHALVPHLSRTDLKLHGVGHRVVHGGERFTAATLIDDSVVSGISDCARLAPLHNPANLAGIAAARTALPLLPQVAVFDTAFHQSMPAVAWRYAVPEAWYREHGVRRYGFHGTSHRFVAARAAELLGRPLSELKLVTAHLGNGCSACAIDGGRSVDTTMGLTPLEGLVMGTRSGDLDPGILAHIAAATGQDIAALTKVLNRDSGLLGLSGLSNDLRTVQEAAARGHAGAELALAVFCYRLAKSIAALTVALGRLDALVFTGGIGEHSAQVRTRTLARLGFLGLVEDPAANAAHGPEHGRITRKGNALALVVPTDEELLIARDTADLIAARSNSRR
ncbi:MAG TPA: acetate kinase [Planctomycetota bacterium]|nr:acetate kinase [Planctomycetota bacterium]